MKTILTISSTKEKILSLTIETLRRGGLVIFPSDTVYGLLVDAGNEKAVKKLIEFKSRPTGKAISVFADWKLLVETVSIDGEKVRRLKELLPGPFTIVLPSKHNVSPLLESEDKTLGVRIPDYPLVNDLVSRYKKPITATSANLSGKSPHYSVGALLNALPEKKKTLIDMIVDAGTLPKRKPSTVVDMTKSKIKILRAGDVNLENKTAHTSSSEQETKRIAKDLVKKILSKKSDKPLALIIKGELGVGKTVFVKGVGEYFGIKNIISPTYVVEYEYDINKHGIKKLIHFDLYTISDPSEFKHLGIERYLKNSNILCFEWGERAGEIQELIKKKTRMITIEIKHLNTTRRKISMFR